MRASLKLFMSVCFLMCRGAAFSQTISTFLPSGSGIDDALILDAEGNLYGSNYDGFRVYKVTPGGVKTTYMGGFGSPNGLAFDTTGVLYVCDNTGDIVYKVTPDSMKTPWVYMNSPSGIYKDPQSDTMIVTQYAGDSIFKIAPNGTRIPWVQGAPFNGPVGLCYDDSLNLYVGNFDDRKVIKVTPDGTVSTLGTIPGSTFLGFLIYLRGNLYGTSFGSSRIYRMDLSGNTTWVAGAGYGTSDGDALTTGKFQRPNGIVPSLTGDSLFISDYNPKSVRVLSGVDSLGFVSIDPTNVIGLELEVGPNPFRGNVGYAFAVPVSGEVRLSVFDLSGKEVAVLEHGYRSAGKYRGNWQANGFAEGTYVVYLQMEGAMKAVKLIVQ